MKAVNLTLFCTTKVLNSIAKSAHVLRRIKRLRGRQAMFVTCVERTQKQKRSLNAVAKVTSQFGSRQNAAKRAGFAGSKRQI